MNDTANFTVMARFFMKAQDLLNEGRITLDVVAEIRNALYGPTVEPIDVEELRRQQHLAAALMRRHDR